MRLILILVIACLFLAACNNAKQNIKNSVSVDSIYKPKYAKGFEISYHGDIKTLTIQNPWEKAANVTVSYKLSLNNKTGNICIPIKSCICLSTTHIPMINAIDEISSIVGVSSPKIASNKTISQKYSAGLISDIGYEDALNYEQILLLKPDVIFTYGVLAGNLGYLKKLNSIGLQSVMNAEYLERHPLGKAEWIVYMSAFYNKENQAKKTFDSIATIYNSLKQLSKNVKNRPLVMSGSPWQGSWWIPGGQSYFAQLIHDAGGDYIWRNDSSASSHARGSERILSETTKAVYWIHCGAAHNLKQLEQMDPSIKHINSFKNKGVFNNNARVNTAGGNDFWETGILEPHIILADLIKILHPEILQLDSLSYYKKLY